MYTFLPYTDALNSTEDVKGFLDSLISNKEIFHPDDDATQVIFSDGSVPTEEEAEQLNLLMSRVIELATEDFCPYDYIMQKTTA